VFYSLEQTYKLSLNETIDLMIDKIFASEKKEKFKLELLFKFSLIEINFKIKYNEYASLFDNNTQFLEINHKFYSLILHDESTYKQINIGVYEFFIKIINEAYDILTKIFENLDQNDVLFNYIAFFSSNKQKNLFNSYGFVFDDAKDFISLKNDLMKSLVKKIIFYSELINGNTHFFIQPNKILTYKLLIIYINFIHFSFTRFL